MNYDIKLLPKPQNIYHVYRITNLVNGKVYIGQTSNPKMRWSKHRSSKQNTHLYSSFKKYGEENFSFDVLLSGLTKEQANSSLRFTFGDANSLSDIDYIVESLIMIIKKLRTQSRSNCKIYRCN